MTREDIMLDLPWDGDDSRIEEMCEGLEKKNFWASGRKRDEGRISYESKNNCVRGELS